MIPHTYHHMMVLKIAITLYTYHDDPLTSPERSTRQLNCVFNGLLRYAPATVRRAAKAHTIPTDNRTAKRLKMGCLMFHVLGIYCQKLHMDLVPTSCKFHVLLLFHNKKAITTKT